MIRATKSRALHHRRVPRGYHVIVELNPAISIGGGWAFADIRVVMTRLSCAGVNENTNELEDVLLAVTCWISKKLALVGL